MLSAAANDSDFFAGLDTDAPLQTVRTPVAEKQKFPCQSCGGSGLWRGRGQCFACKGKGFFDKPQFDKTARKAKAAVSLATKLLAFEEQNPGLFLWLFENKDRSEFLHQPARSNPDQGFAVRETTRRRAQRQERVPGPSDRLEG